MKKLTCYFVVAITTFMCFLPVRAEWQNSLKPDGEPGPELTLARNSQTDYVIVVPNKSTSQEHKAAVELSRWLGDMTGAFFSIVLDSAEPIETEISVGRTNRLKEAQIPEAAADLADEGYAIGAKGKRLFLIGGKKRGPIYAVYALLEEDLGCRWYHVNNYAARNKKEENRIPHIPNLSFKPVLRSYVPVLSIRDPFYVDAFNTTWSLRNRTNSPRKQEDADQYASSDAPVVPAMWGGRVVCVPGFVHTFYTILPPKEYFDEHPEYYALIDGKRSMYQLCQTHPEVIKIVIERMMKVLDNNPSADVLEISQNDNRSYCHCSECEAINKENDSPAGSLIYFVNEIAKAIEEKHPDVTVSTLAYLSTLEAPTKIKPWHNVSIRLCNDVHSWRLPLIDFVSSDHERSKKYKKAIVDWSKICDNLTIWDYFVNFTHYIAPTPNMHVLQPSVDFYVKHNVKGLMFQAAFQSMGGERAAMRSWVMAKLFWDPSLKVEDLVNDFVWGYYEDAAPAILKYYNLLEETGRKHQPEMIELALKDLPGTGIRFNMNSPIFTKQFLEQATETLEQAEEMAKTDEVRHRVQVEQLPIMYVKLMQGLEATGKEYGKILDKFERIARSENINYFGDQGGGPDFEKNLQMWRENLRNLK